MKDARELRCELQRISTALTCPVTRQYTRTEVDRLIGALHALAWALDHAATPPVEWIDTTLSQVVSRYTAERLVERIVQPTTFLDRSQPREV